jgi:tetratricopeptide (TPR) repeat protein
VWNHEITEDTWASNSIIENLSALGLVNLKPEAAAVLEACVLERQLNAAQTYAVQGRFADAVEAYQTALERQDAISVRLPYIECLFFLERLDQVSQEVAAVAAAAPDAVITCLLQARLSIARRDFAAAEDLLDRVRYTELPNTGVLLQLGWTALSLRRFEQSSMVFEQILARDPECAQAHDGLGSALLRMGRIEESVFHHTESIRLLYHRSAAHEHLGESLVAAGQLDWAERAFKIALELDPNNRRVHKWLRRVENLRRDSQGGGTA